jgi:hypothetical protein
MKRIVRSRFQFRESCFKNNNHIAHTSFNTPEDQKPLQKDMSQMPREHINSIPRTRLTAIAGKERRRQNTIPCGIVIVVQTRMIPCQPLMILQARVPDDLYESTLQDFLVGEWEVLRCLDGCGQNGDILHLIVF